MSHLVTDVWSKDFQLKLSDRITSLHKAPKHEGVMKIILHRKKKKEGKIAMYNCFETKRLKLLKGILNQRRW